jgi:transcriptional regulator with XRE-family HTH domain
VNTSSQSPPQITDLGDALRQHRYRNRLSQKQLALRIGVTQQTVARWEHGSPPRPDMLPHIHAELKGVSADLGQIINLHEISNRSRDDPEIEAQQESFLNGCAEIVRRGEKVPDKLMLLVAFRLGLIEDERP